MFIASQVDTNVTPEDKLYCDSIVHRNLESMHLRNAPTNIQINTIHQIQCEIIKYSRHEQIPFGLSREPKNYFKEKRGFCFDRARVIEKTLKSLGYKTRHLSIYRQIDSTEIHWYDLLSPNLNSHAVTEVLIDKKWMYIGSNQCFIGADRSGNIYNYKEMQHINLKSIPWINDKSDVVSRFINPKTISIIGLYSRNGKMYPPYFPIPEISYSEFMYNFTN